MAMISTGTTLNAAAALKATDGHQARALRAFRATPFTYATLIVVSSILFVPFILLVSIALSSDATVNQNAFTIIPRGYPFAGGFFRSWNDCQKKIHGSIQ